MPELADMGNWVFFDPEDVVILSDSDGCVIAYGILGDPKAGFDDDTAQGPG